MEDWEEPDEERRARLDDASREELYQLGYADGQEELMKSLRTKLKKDLTLREKWDDVLHDPEKLIVLAKEDPEVENAITMAVVAMLMAPTK